MYIRYIYIMSLIEKGCFDNETVLQKAIKKVILIKMINIFKKFSNC